MQRVVGHIRQRERLERLWRKNKLPSALMLTGDAGIGKRLVARELFRTLFCERGEVYGGCGECHACHLFDSGNHPDFHERDCLQKEEAAVEGLRELLYSLHLSAYSGGRRAVLFNNVDYLSLQGANLLLKIVEEPRPDTYFCLITANPSRLPATLLSRCHLWFFDRLADDEVAAAIEQAGISPPPGLTAADLAVLADGTLEQVAALDSSAEDWQMLPERLDRIAAGEAAAAGELAYELGKDREALRGRLRLMRIHARSRMYGVGSDAERVTWSVCLTNLLEAEYLIFERNIGAAYLLGLILADLADRERAESRPLFRSDRLVEEIVV